MRPTERKLGRRGGVRSKNVGGDRKTLDRARWLFADVTKKLKAEILRLRRTETDEPDPKRMAAITDLIRQTQKAMQTSLDMEAKLMPDQGSAVAGEQDLDLDAARAEIDCRLARLAA